MLPMLNEGFLKSFAGRHDDAAACFSNAFALAEEHQHSTLVQSLRRAAINSRAVTLQYAEQRDLVASTTLLEDFVMCDPGANLYPPTVANLSVLYEMRVDQAAAGSTQTKQEALRALLIMYRCDALTSCPHIAG